jgi:hypothetical protein
METETQATWLPLDSVAQERLRGLRKKIPEHEISYLPRATCKDCGSVFPKQACPKHKLLQECANCHSRRCTSAHVDIPSVDHVYVEQRLFEADPGYRIRFIGADEHGFPVITFTGEGANRYANLWGTIEICGVERSEVGTVEAGKANLHKELMSDLIKRLGLRLGVGAELRDRSAIRFPREAESKGGRSSASASVAAPAQPVTAAEPAIDAKVIAQWVSRIAEVKTVAELRAIQEELRDPKMETIRAVAEVKDAFVSRANVFKQEQAQRVVDAASDPAASDEEDSTDGDAVDLPSPRRRARRAA